MTIQITLHDFFGVKQNEIELAPFMIFCGDNGSGKTHLVKVLNSIDDCLRNPAYGSEFLKYSFIEKLPIPINLDDIVNKGIEIRINEQNEIYDFIEEAMNELVNKNQKNILLNTFSDIDDVLGRISVKYTYRPNITIKISYGNEDVIEDTLVKDHFINEEEEEKPKPIKFKFITDDEVLESGVIIGKSIQKNNDKLEIDEILLRVIRRNVLRGLMRLVYRLNFNVTDQKSFYFPASREAYMRDFSYFFGNNTKTRKITVKEYDLLSESDEKINLHSNDPYIEKFVTQMIEVVEGNDKHNSKLIEFMESKFLKVKFHSKNNTHKYILENEKMISTDLGSSLQNEYSFLRVLLGRRQTSNIVIEEPEAHLSIKNSVFLAYFLVSIHQLLKSKVWITTHSNFIVDAINNMIMLSSLNPEQQIHYLEKIGTNELIKSIDKKTVDNITSYFLLDGKVEKLEKGKYGIKYESFNRQINDFIDISSDLRWDVNDLSEDNEVI